MSKEQIPDSTMDQAMQWHIRLQESDVATETWTDFAQWLDQDAMHNLAYDRVTATEHDLETWAEAQKTGTENLLPEPANDEPTRRSWFGYGAMGLAASLLLTIILWPQFSGPQFRTIATEPGQTEIVELEDGSRIEINGDSKVILNPDDPRYARLDHGEAIFYVEHDARNPFTVFSGNYELVDRGTIFNVQNTDQEFSVGVSEGAVLLKGEQKLVDIQAGKILTIAKDGSAALKNIEPANIGTWTKRQLIYDLVPIGTLIADVNRNMGMSITIDPSLSSQKFSGTIQMSDDRDQVIQQLEQLLDANAQDTERGWHLKR